MTITITLTVPEVFADLEFLSPLIIIWDWFLVALPWLVFFSLLIGMLLLLICFLIAQMESCRFSFYKAFLGELVLLYFSIFWYINIIEPLTKTGG
jgi:hypothetical protein